MLPILYSFRRCPYAMRARLAIAHAGQRVILREVILRDKPAAMLAVSPKATVPVLVLADGTVLEQSLDIMHWALAPQLSIAEHALIAENDNGFKLNLDRYKYADRYPEMSQIQYREAAESFLARLETRLQPNLHGSEMGFTDWAILPFVRQFANVERDWFADAAYPQVRDWLQRFAMDRQYAVIMDKYPQWHQGDDEHFFPN